MIQLYRYSVKLLQYVMMKNKILCCHLLMTQLVFVVDYLSDLKIIHLPKLTDIIADFCSFSNRQSYLYIRVGVRNCDPISEAPG